MIDRRQFLKIAGIGTAGIGLGKTAGAGMAGALNAASAGQSGPTDSPRIKVYRPLGKTGLNLSDIGFGAIKLFNPNALRYAYDCGVNHFDTAEGYLNKNSEKMLGQTLKDIRSKVVITTKHLLEGPSDMNKAALIGRVEASLKRLQTDYLDVALVHSVDEPEKLDNEEVIAAYTQLKKAGKARFIGFSTHKPAVMLKKALQSDIWEVVLTIYNHMEGPPVDPLVAQARKKGIGLIAMKVFAGGMQGSLKSFVNDKASYSQAAIRWVLGNPNIDACILSMSTYTHIEEYIAASGMPLVRSDLGLIARYQREAGDQYCRVSCSECLSACPLGVAVNEVLRYAMYFEHYGMEKNAIQLYDALDERQKPVACNSCNAPCEAACPYGLKVREKLLRSRGQMSS